jgi:hypothetical protein
MKQTMKTPKGRELAATAGKLPGQIAKLDAVLAAIAARMAELKRAGLIYAAEHWREGRYLYLIFPMRDGQRPKPAYVGCDPARIAEAQAALARAVEFDALAEQQRRLEWLADSVARQLRSTLAELDVLRHFERKVERGAQELADLER